MLKSLMLAVACAYINPPGLQPNAPVVQATVPEILKQAYAMEPGTQKEIIIDHGDGLCSKVMIEPSTDEALNAFIDPDAAKNFAVPLPRSRPADAPKVVADCPRPTPEADADCHKAEVAGK
jgi:hypothetical protein